MDLPPIGLEAVLDDKNFQDGLKRFNSGTDDMMSRTSSVASILSGTLVTAFGVAVAAIGGFVAISKVGLDATLKWGAELGELSDQFGMDGAEASKWAVAMKHVGLSVQEGAGGLNFFTKNLDDMKKASSGSKVEMKDNSEAVKKLKEQVADANIQLQRAQINLSKAKQPTDQMKWAVEDAQKKVNRLNAELASTPATITKLKPAADTLSPFGEALKKLGVNAYDTKGKLKTFDQIMPQIMDAFQKLPAGVNSTALAMDLFGTRGGTKFLDFLKQGSAGLKDAEKFAEQFGLELESDGVDAVEGFEFAMNDLQLALQGIWNQIGLAVLPIVRDLVDFVQKNVLPVFAQWSQDIGPKVYEFLRGLGTIAGETFKLIKEQKWEEIAARFWTWAENVKTQAEAKLGEVTGKIAAFIRDHWEPDIKPKIIEWANKFWVWLTDPKEGVLKLILDKLSEVTVKIAKALADLWDKDIKPAIMEWVGKFWAWVTDPNGGLLVTVAENMGKITASLKDWSEQETTKESMRGIGRTIASTIIDAIGGLFESGDTGKNLLQKLGDGIMKAITSVRDAFANVGSGIASGIVEEIAKKFVDPAMAKKIADAFGEALTAVLKILLSPTGSVATFAEQIANAIKNWILITFGIDPNTRSGNSRTANNRSYSVAVPGSNAAYYSNSHTQNNTYNLNINSSSMPARVAADFGIMRSLAGA